MEKLTNSHGLVTTAVFLAHVIYCHSDYWEDGGDGSIMAKAVKVTDQDGSEGMFDRGTPVEAIMQRFGKATDVEVPHSSIQGRYQFPDGSAILEIEGEFVEEDNE